MSCRLAVLVLLFCCIGAVQCYTQLKDDLIVITCAETVSGGHSVQVNDIDTADRCVVALNHFSARGYTVMSHASHLVPPGPMNSASFIRSWTLQRPGRDACSNAK